MMRHALAILLPLAFAAGLDGRVQQTTPPAQSALTPEQQQQVSKMPALGEEKRVKTEDIDSVMADGKVFLLDVRQPKEIDELGGYEGAVNIPLPELEGRLAEIPKDKTILTT